MPPAVNCDSFSEVDKSCDSDSEIEEIFKDIAQCKEEGPAKPNHTPHTIKLWKREGEFWARYCTKIQKRTHMSPNEQLRACNPEVFKAYLRWRTKHSRVQKESSIRSYWKRLSMCYMDLTRHTMDQDILTDVCNWIPSLKLDKSEKEKHAMYVQDLYAILHALWVDDRKPLHGFVRVQISLLLLLSAATATRPGAIVESATVRGTNKALAFKDVEVMKVRSTQNSHQSTIIANINLEHVKNKDKDGKPKKFTFRLEGLLAFCIVSHVLAVGLSQQAFRDNVSSVETIFNLTIPPDREVLRLRWKDEVLQQPFFCDVKATSEGGCMLKDKAFSYAKYRETFVRLGRVAGFEKPLELYQLRRASGRNINSVLTEAERNQTMGHLGSTYEKYYTPTHIARDFQSIYFGSPSQNLLIESVARMGLTRDRRAPVDLTAQQLEEVSVNPLLLKLRERRNQIKNELRAQGFYPIRTAAGTNLYQKYTKAQHAIASTFQKLRREKLSLAIQEFHDSIDTEEIARQLNNKPSPTVLTLPKVDFEIEERAAVANMLFKVCTSDCTRVKFVRSLSQLCHRQEARHPKDLKRKHEEPDSRNNVKQIRTLKAECVRISANEGHPFSLRLAQPACLICIGNSQFTYERRLRPIPRKDVLRKHVQTHFRKPEYNAEFQCRHPQCSTMLRGIMQFMRHALDVHGVVH